MKTADTENIQLKAEIAALKKGNKDLSQKLEKLKCKKLQLQKELKKTTLG